MPSGIVQRKVIAHNTPTLTTPLRVALYELHINTHTETHTQMHIFTYTYTEDATALRAGSELTLHQAVEVPWAAAKGTRARVLRELQLH